MSNTIWNVEMQKWIDSKNECVCSDDECCCKKDHGIRDYFERHYMIPNERKILLGYIIYWKNKVPYITVDKVVAKPIQGVKVPADALIVQIVGTEDKHGVLNCEEIEVLVSKEVINE